MRAFLLAWARRVLLREHERGGHRILVRLDCPACRSASRRAR